MKLWGIMVELIGEVNHSLQKWRDGPAAVYIAAMAARRTCHPDCIFQ